MKKSKSKKKQPKSKIPNQEQILAQATALQKMMPSIRKFTAFGDNNHAAISAQVDVLKNDLTDSEIYEKYEHTESVCSAALEARQWMDGESSYTDLEEDIVASWQSLVEK